MGRPPDLRTTVSPIRNFAIFRLPSICARPRSPPALRPDFYQLGREAKPHHVDVHAQFYVIDQWLQHEGGKPQGGGCTALLSLQLRQAPFGYPLHPGYGGWGEPSSMVFGGNGK